MTISRRTFLAGASAFSIMVGLASSAADQRIFAPNGGWAADFLICRRLYLDICGRIPTPEEVTEYVNSRNTKKLENLVDTLLAFLDVTGGDILGHLLGRGNAPADVEIQAAADEEVGRLAAVRREDALVGGGRRQALHDGERRRAREKRST